MSWKTAVVLACCALFVSTGALFGAEVFVTANPDNTFTPENVTINVGDTVTWTNNGGLHNVEATDGSFRCANGCDGDGMGGDGSPATNGWTASVTFDDPGLVSYFCIVHLGIGMSGTVNVLDGGGSDLALDITGQCPGDIDVSVTGATPNSGVAFAIAGSEGTSNVPVGNCAGTELGLNSPSLLTVINANGQGEVNFSRTTNAGNCGRWLQLVDSTSCDVSNTEQIP